MNHMLCRNRVVDFEQWHEVFASHAEAQRAAGLRLLNLWRSIEDSNNIFFVFEIESLEKAREFINNPEASKAGKISGILDGEFHFLEETVGY